ncbi:non-ribosomal peptide synthetase [Anaerocolumna xylanovorans]|uniref:Amino acid adenylation domain-containing protein n=1 Tax=Anaerocolumna xylanovorans DSM 12503 TaxID=1121345 RepID=A0A1M7XZA0_9FIRM|nr:non-ribosomal peptide synthetase [Anaerocolumna xylanovorans]SHO44487.1 amino acid adenylation domain-containing protein [Anaerocolumna xylanovorans DSM 12503]
MNKADFLKLSDSEKRRYLSELVKNKENDTYQQFVHKHKYPEISEEGKDRFSLFPLTETQESFFVGKMIGKGDNKVGCHIYFEIEEKYLDTDRLEDAWNLLIHHHEMLRDQMMEKGKQRILEHVNKYQIKRYNLEDGNEATMKEHIETLRNRMSHKVYGTADYPLYEICVTLMKEDRAIIHFSIDEWIVDATSVSILFEQWYQLYHNKDYELCPLTLTFRDFVMAQKKFEYSTKFKEDLEYWKNKLFHLQNYEISFAKKTDRENVTDSGTGLTQERKRHEYILNKQKWSKLKQMALQAEVSPTAVLLHLFSAVIKEFNENKDLPVILTYFNRLPFHKDIDKVVGPFVTTMIYNNLEKTETTGFEESLQGVQRQLWEDNDHNSVSGVRILRELKKDKRIDANYTIPIVFTSMINSIQSSEGEKSETWFNQVTYSITQTPQVFLDHQIMEINGELRFHWDVQPDYFKDTIIDRMFEQYCTKLEELGKDSIALYINQETDERESLSCDLTDLQRSHVYNQLMDSNSDFDRMLYQEFIVTGDSIERIQKRWNQLVNEMDAFNTVFTKQGKQKIIWQAEHEIIPVVDLSLEIEERKERTIEQIRTEMTQKVFSLYQLPRYDLRIIKLGEDCFRLNMSFDSSIVDGRSLAILYQKLFEKKEDSLLEKVSFRAYMNAKAEYQKSSDAENNYRYWEKRFDELSGGPLIEYRKSDKSDAETLRISAVVKQYKKLKDLTLQRGVEIESILITVYMDVLRKYSNRENFTVVCVNWDRPDTKPSIANTVGELSGLSWLENLDSERPFAERVIENDRLRKMDIAHQLVSGITSLRKAKEALMFPVVFTSLVKDEMLELPDNIEFGAGLSKTPQVYLDNVSFIHKGRLLVNWDYKDIFPKEMVEKMFKDYVDQIEQLCVNGFSERISGEDDVSLQGKCRCIHEFVELQAGRYPKNIALKCKEDSVTYEELNRRANQLAHYLRKAGVARDVLVGLCLEKSNEMIIAILAILKAGGAYVPIDPNYPLDRIAFILEDCKTDIVITKENAREKIINENINRICIDRLESDIEKESPENVGEKGSSAQLAYVIYTSGSTGKPKGVLITHHNVVRLFEQTKEWYGFNERDIWTMYHSYAFDFSVWEIWGALIYGGTLIVVPYELSRSFAKMYELLEKEKVTVLNQTPTAFKQLMKVEEEEGQRNLSLRYIIFGGEALNLKSLKGWFDRHGDRKPQLVNMYGITETTVHVTYRPLQSADVEADASLIGEAIPDLNFYILDEDLREVKIGEIGEICVGGPGLAKGYLNRPEITKEKFIEHPYKPGERLYLSGDLGRYTKNFADIEYMGRKDSQVKIRGFRIELGEIETVLTSHPNIKEAAVTVEEGGQESKILAFVVGSGAALDTTQIRKYVRSKLPDYMVPNIIKQIESIPMTINGKLDYRQLMKNQTVEEPNVDGSENRRNKDFILSRLHDIFKEELEEDHVEDTEDIFNLGATSLTIVNIAKRIQEEMDVDIPIDIFLDTPRIGEIGNYVIDHYVSLTEVSDEKEQKAESVKQTANQDKQLDAGLTEDELREIFASELEEDDIDVEEDIFNLGATSLTIVNVVKQIREKKGIEVEMDVFLEHPTVRDIIKYIKTNAVSTEPEEKAQINNLNSLQLYDTGFNNSVYKRYKERCMSHNRPITKTEISRLLGLLKKETIGLKSHYLYASAGGKNSVQTYVYLKKNAVEHIAEGIYYYHPEEHQLYYISQGNKVVSEIFPEHYQKEYEQAGFVIFFIAQLKAIEPVYLDFSTGLVTIDTGYMQELLLNNQEACNIGLCYVEGIDFDRVKEDFHLDEGHIFINGMLGCSLCQDDESYQPKLSGGNELIKHFKTKPTYITKEEQEEKFKNMKYNQLSKREVLELAKKKLHLRTFENNNSGIALSQVNYDPVRYLKRTSKREYKQEKVSLQQLSEFLSVLRGVQLHQETQYLYPSVCNAHLVSVFLYVKDNAIENLEEGIYEYHQRTHKLNLINPYKKSEIEYCHTPFNRPHYKASGFSIYLVANLQEAKKIYGEGYLKYVMTEAGFMGQLLMDCQAACEIGLVPIGGMNFERVRQEFRLGNECMLLHSFMGGKYDYSKINNAKNDDKKEDKPTEDAIAIVGMSGRYPKANSIMEFWENIKNARNCISNIEDNTYRLIRDENCYGGFIDDIEKFDASFFRLSRGEAELLDPQVRLFLEAAYQSMDDAGYQIGERQDVGVFVGSMYQHYHLLNPDSEDADLMAIQSYSSIANRVSYCFNFTGPSVAVDTACSSSIVALQMAVDSLRKDECSSAIVGGVNLSLHDSKYSALKKMGLVSSQDRTSCFGNGDGFIPGEGIGAFVIKKLSQAKKDKNHIYGIIKAIGINHTGRTNAYSMPSAAMEEDLIRKTIRRAGIQIGDISYIESAANGTTLGDATEFSALNKVFRDTKSIPIGSVKSNVGHLEAASGMVQIAKVLLQFQFNQLVPTINVDEINPLIDIKRSNLVIQKTLEQWNRIKAWRDNTEQELPRIALINSFAAGGTNACTIIEEYIGNYQEEAEDKNQQDFVFLFSADNKDSLFIYLDSMKEFLIHQQDITMQDLSFSLANKVFLKNKLVILAKYREELITKLNQVIEKTGNIPGVYRNSESNGSGLYRIFRENRELKALIQQWTKENCFNELAEIWVNDIPVEWKKVTMLQKGRKIMLPVYTFHRETLWITKSSSNGEVLKKAQTSNLAVPESASTTETGMIEETESKEHIITDLLCEIMKIQKNELSPGQSVRDIGFNSLYAIRLINSIKDKYKSEISIRQVMSCRTIEELESEIEKCMMLQ